MGIGEDVDHRDGVDLERSGGRNRILAFPTDQAENDNGKGEGHWKMRDMYGFMQELRTHTTQDYYRSDGLRSEPCDVLSKIAIIMPEVQWAQRHQKRLDRRGNKH